MKPVLIIAEAGVNHNGKLDLAKKLVDAAKETGADYVKFQTFKTEELIRPNTELAVYQKSGTEYKTQFDMLRSLELSYKDFEQLFAYAEKQKMNICSTAFDLDSMSFLVGLGQKIFKMSSGDMTNLPLIRAIVKAKPEMAIMSTGAATMNEVIESVEAFRKEGMDMSRLVVLHCTTQYPCPPEDVNLLAMPAMAEKLGVTIGYSDHSESLLTSAVAVALGAQVIEKHMTLDKAMPGPDHKASLNPKEFGEMVRMIRTTEQLLGNPDKQVVKSESLNRNLGRKAIVAKAPIAKGEVIRAEMLTSKRPADGLSPMLWDQVVGSKAIRDFKPNESIEIQKAK